MISLTDILFAHTGEKEMLIIYFLFLLLHSLNNLRMSRDYIGSSVGHWAQLDLIHPTARCNSSLYRFLTLYCKRPFTEHRWHTDNKSTAHTIKPDRQGEIFPTSPKTPNSTTVSLDTSCSSNHHTSSPPPSPPRHPTIIVWAPKSFFSHALFFSVLFWAEEEEVEGSDGVVMATPHWHGPDWSMQCLIIQCICLRKKKNNKVGRIEIPSQASYGVWLTYELRAAFEEGRLSPTSYCTLNFSDLNYIFSQIW